MQEYGQFSGFKINKDKTVLLTKNLSEREEKELVQSTGFNTGVKVKYLGIWIAKRNNELFQNNYEKKWKEITKDLQNWSSLRLSLMGRISAVKMNILPKMNFLFQNLPIITNMKPFLQWKRELTKFIWQGKKPRIKWNIMTDIKTRGGMGLPDLQLYYRAAAFMWIKDWIDLQDMKTLALEGADLRMGWHAYMFYDKARIDKDFSHHYIRKALLKIWDDFKVKNMRQLPTWVSPQEAFFGRWTDTDKWLRYEDIIESVSNNLKMKTREKLEQEGIRLSWFPYRQLTERFQMDIKTYGIEQKEKVGVVKWIFENPPHLLAQIHQEILLQERQEETIKETMILWAQNIGHSIQLESWEQSWKKTQKFTVAQNLRENYYKLFHRWYMTPDKLRRIYNTGTGQCWKCQKEIGTIYHMWWTCPKAKKFWIEIHNVICTLLKGQFAKTPELYLLNMTDNIEDVAIKKHWRILLYMITTARIEYAKLWKIQQIPTIEQWWASLIENKNADMVSQRLKGKSDNDIQKEWQIVTGNCWVLIDENA